MAGQHNKEPGLPWSLRSTKAKKSRDRKRGRPGQIYLGPGAAKTWSLDKAVKYSEHGQAMRTALKLKNKKKAKGVGIDHFTKLTKKKKVPKGPISR